MEHIFEEYGQTILSIMGAALIIGIVIAISSGTGEIAEYIQNFEKSICGVII